MLICPKCGHDNQLGHLFCHSCGDKLDLSNIKAPTAAEKSHRQSKRGVVHGIRIGMELVMAGGFGLGIVLICLTPVVAPVTPISDELIASDAKHIALEQLAHGEKPGHVVVTAAELNASFNHPPPEIPPGQGSERPPVTVRMTLSTDRVKIELLGTYFHKNIYFGYEGQPTVTGGHFVFQPTGGWLGKLPIHPKILQTTSWFESFFVRLFGAPADEKALLDKLTGIVVTKESVEFVKDAAPAH